MLTSTAKKGLPSQQTITDLSEAVTSLFSYLSVRSKFKVNIAKCKYSFCWETFMYIPTIFKISYIPLDNDISIYEIFSFIKYNLFLFIAKVDFEVKFLFYIIHDYLIITLMIGPM